MTDPQTPAGERLRRWWRENVTPKMHPAVDEAMPWDEMVRVVLDMPERDRSSSENAVEELMTDALQREWRHFMSASRHDWRKKARAMIARMGEVAPLFDFFFGTSKDDANGHLSFPLMDENMVASMKDWQDAMVSVYVQPEDIEADLLPPRVVGKTIEVAAKVEVEGAPRVAHRFLCVGYSVNQIQNGEGRVTTQFGYVGQDGVAILLRRDLEVKVVEESDLAEDPQPG